MLPEVLNLSVEKTLPVSKKKVRIRGINVKEQKLLITATESHESQKDLLLMMIDTVKVCLVGKSKITVEKLCLADLMSLFLSIIELSSGSSIEKSYKCQNKLENGEVCNHEFTVKFDSNKIDVIGNTNLEPIRIDGNTAVTLEYPSPLVLCDIYDRKDLDESNKAILLIAKCMKSVCTSDGTTYNDFSEEECVEWISNLSFEQFSILTKVFKDIPTLVIKQEYVCEKCGYKHTLLFESIEDFFTLDSQGTR